MFHIAKYHDEDVILLGHIAADKECWLINLTALPDDEQSALWGIARSPAAQHTPYLASLLSTTGMIKTGTETWREWLMTGDDPVVAVPLADLDSLDPEQRTIFERMEQRVDNRPAYNQQTAAMVQQLSQGLGG